MRLRGIAFVLFFAAAARAGAHPAVGIVMDRAGNVFYSDLTQVWKISPDGRKTVAVPNVHTHELYLDAAGNLFGEHLWYEGEATDKWGYRVWRFGADGRLVDVIPAREGFRTDYSFVRDGAGAMYWVDREPRTVFRKREPGGGSRTVAECRNCRDVRWMTAAPDGTVYFTDETDLREISRDGRIRTIARRIGRRVWTQPHAGRHVVMGLWLDGARNVYAAIYGSREVKRVSPAGRVSVVARSRIPWSPTGGMVAANGDLWVLENSATNAVRVRRIPGIAPARSAGSARNAAERARCRELLDDATRGVEAAIVLFESKAPAGDSAVAAARNALVLARRARDSLEDARVIPACVDARSEELIYLNHLIPGFESWLAARTMRPPREYELASIIRRARTHRERGRAALR